MDLLRAKIAALSDSIEAAKKLKVQQTTATAVAAEPLKDLRGQRLHAASRRRVWQLPAS